MKSFHGCILSPLLLIAGIWAGSDFSTSADFIMAAAALVVLVFAGMMAFVWSRDQIGDEVKVIGDAISTRNKITAHYNQLIASLVTEFTKEKQKLAESAGPHCEQNRLDKHGEALRQKFDQRFANQKAAYEREIGQLPDISGSDTPRIKRVEKLWHWLVPIGFYLLLFSCSFTTATSDSDGSIVTSLLEVEDGDKLWNADNIVLPHLTDGSRYVSNPDSIISPMAEAELNKRLRRLEDSLGVESAVIIVNRLEGGDEVRFAQEVFDRYGIGKDDRGLVMVIAVKDRVLRTHTGYALQLELTDQECYMLQEEYLIPSMKADQPATGLLYWVDALDSLLRHKQIPALKLMAEDSTANNDEDTGHGGWLALLFFLMFGGWWIFTGMAQRRFTRKALNPLTVLHHNPFSDLLTGKIKRNTYPKKSYRDYTPLNDDDHRSSSSSTSVGGSILGSILSGVASGGDSSRSSSGNSGSSGGGFRGGYSGGRSGGSGASSRW